MNAEPTGIDSIYLAAVDIPDGPERLAYLDRVCGSDVELRRRVDRLIAAQSKVGSFLESPAPELHSTVVHDPVSRPGRQIGPYRLLQQIGEGGMGAVFMAEQTAPVQRLVALKIIRPGMDSRQVIARFELERQVLAMMDHPHIARVLEVGATEDGSPYFVMELVKGVPITRYCDEHRLGVRERIELFVPVCQAIQHAHQKGIIHRDIKPGNVLVASCDGRPVPKVIDFGVAKATRQKLTEKTNFTEFGQVIGTLEYMSPEQAEFNQLDIDTRTDIYSLGVLLYELLTGTTPLNRRWMEAGAFPELLRMIREVEPPRPSQRLRTSGAAQSIAASRGVDHDRLSGLLQRELDWIVMKALEKDRSRRYETADGFAADLRRYLTDEPVLACPPSAGYRIQKFVRRNRGQAAAALAILCALVVGLIVSLSQMNRAIDAERVAETSRDAAVEGNRQARAALDAVTEDVVQSLFGKGATLSDQERQFLKKVLGFYDSFTRFEGDSPEALVLKARGYQKIALLQGRFGAREDAVDAYRQMREIYGRLADGSPEVVEYRLGMAGALRQESHELFVLGRRAESDRLLDEAQSAIDELALRSPNDPEIRKWIAVCLTDRAHRLVDDSPERAESMYREALAGFDALIQELPDEVEFRILAADDAIPIGELLNGTGREAEAIPIVAAALERLEDPTLEQSPDAHVRALVEARKGRAQWVRGQLLATSGQYPAAAEALAQAVSTNGRVVDGHPAELDPRLLLARAQLKLGQVLAKLRRTPESFAILREAEANAQRLVADFPQIGSHAELAAEILNALANAYANSGSRVEAIEALRIAAEYRESHFDQIPNSVANLKNIGDYYNLAGHWLWEANRHEDALQALRQSIAAQERLCREVPDSREFQFDLARNREFTAWLLLEFDKREEAIAELSTADALYASLVEAHPDDPQYRRKRADLRHSAAERLLQRGDAQGALDNYQAAIDVRERFIADFPDLSAERLAKGESHRGRGRLLFELGRFDEGVAEFEAAVVSVGDVRDNNPPHVRFLEECGHTLDQRAEARRQSGGAADALRVFRRVLGIRDRLVSAFPHNPDFHNQIAWSHYNIASAQIGVGAMEPAVEALRLFVDRVNHFADSFPQDESRRRNLADTLDKGADLLRAAGLPRESADMFQQTLQARERLARDFPNNPIYDDQIAWTRFHLGGQHLVLRDESAAIDSFRRAYRTMEDRYGRDPSNVSLLAGFDDLTAKICLALNRARLLESTVEFTMRYRTCVAGARPTGVPPDNTVLSCAGFALSRLKRYREAEGVLREVLASRHAAEPNSWQVFNTRSELGEILLEQNQLDGAGEFLQSGYEGLAARHVTIPEGYAHTLRDAAARLVRWAETTGQTAEAERWRREVVRLDGGESAERRESPSPDVSP